MGTHLYTRNARTVLLVNPDEHNCAGADQGRGLGFSKEIGEGAGLGVNQLDGEKTQMSKRNG